MQVPKVLDAMRGRLGVLARQQGALHWRDAGVVGPEEAAAAVAASNLGPGRRRQRRPLAPPPAPARDTAALLQDCLRDLSQSRDAEAHRRALEELRRQQQLRGLGDGPAVAKDAARRLYACLDPADLGLLVSRAVGMGEWSLVDHVLAHGEGWIQLSRPPEATVVRCCRKGQPGLAWRLLQRLADQRGERLLLAPTVYVEVAQALGKAGHMAACVELAQSPWVPREGPACFVAAARACARVGDVGRARALLQDAVGQGLEPSSAAYEAVLAGCAQQGDSAQGAEVLAEMKVAGVTPSEIGYGAVLSACVKTRDWRLATWLLRDMREQGVFPDHHCYTAVLEVCALVGQWHRVPQLLDSMLGKGLEAPRALYLWLLGRLSRAGRWREAADTLERMGRQGLATDDAEAHRLVLLACRRSGQWQKALVVLQELRRRGVRPSPACIEMALAACARGGRWEEARALFDELQRRTSAAAAAAQDPEGEVEVVTAAYGAMLGLCGRKGRWREALALLEGMEAMGLVPDASMHLQGALLACKEAGPARWEEALGLLDRLDATGGDPATKAACYALALGACGKAGRWQVALARLRALLKLSPKAAVAAAEEGCFEAVLEACARAGRWEEALALLGEAQQIRRREQLPEDADPYALTMWACVQGGQPERAVGLMVDMAGEWVAPNPRAHLTLLKALQQLGRVEESVAAFGAALEGPGALRLEVHLSKALATALHTCARGGRWREMLQLLAFMGPAHKACDDGSGPGPRSPRRQQHQEQQLQRVLAGVDVLAAARKAVDVLVEAGRAHEAGEFLEALARETGLDLDSGLIHRLLFGLASEGDWVGCQALLVDGGLRARFGIPPTVQAFASAMSGAAAARRVGDGAEPPDFLAAMRAQGLVPDVVAFNVAVNLQRRLGHWERAMALLQEAEAAGVRPDVVTYTTAIAACGEAGRWERADELFEAMQSQGVESSIVTYTALMTSFGRAGELGRCRALRRSMAAAGVNPDARFYGAALAALAPAGDEEGCLGVLEEIRAREQEQEQESEQAVDLVRPRLDGATYQHVAALCEAARRPELLAVVDRGARTSAV